MVAVPNSANSTPPCTRASTRVRTPAETRAVVAAPIRLRLVALPAREDATRKATAAVPTSAAVVVEASAAVVAEPTSPRKPVNSSLYLARSTRRASLSEGAGGCTVSCFFFRRTVTADAHAMDCEITLPPIPEHTLSSDALRTAIGIEGRPVPLVYRPLPDWQPLVDGRVEDRYPYVDCDGTALFEVLRVAVRASHPAHPDTVFLTRRFHSDASVRQDLGCPDSTVSSPGTSKCETASSTGVRHEADTGWSWGTRRSDLRLYRLPAVRRAVREGRRIYIVEGEKDANRLHDIGLIATCNPHGGLQWIDRYAETLAKAHVVLVPDDDPIGVVHAFRVAESLQRHVSTLRAVRLHGRDVSEWLDAGGTAAELQQRADDAPPNPTRAALADQLGVPRTLNPTVDTAPRLRQVLRTVDHSRKTAPARPAGPDEETDGLPPTKYSRRGLPLPRCVAESERFARSAERMRRLNGAVPPPSPAQRDLSSDALAYTCLDGASAVAFGGLAEQIGDAFAVERLRYEMQQFAPLVHALIPDASSTVPVDTVPVDDATAVVRSPLTRLTTTRWNWHAWPLDQDAPREQPTTYALTLAQPGDRSTQEAEPPVAVQRMDALSASILKACDTVQPLNVLVTNVQTSLAALRAPRSGPDAPSIRRRARTLAEQGLLSPLDEGVLPLFASQIHAAISAADNISAADKPNPGRDNPSSTQTDQELAFEASKASTNEAPASANPRAQPRSRLWTERRQHAAVAMRVARMAESTIESVTAGTRTIHTMTALDRCALGIERTLRVCEVPLFRPFLHAYWSASSASQRALSLQPIVHALLRIFDVPAAWYPEQSYAV